jgi:hypothetical protein
LPRSSPKHAGPVKTEVPDSDTVVLRADRTFKWPLLIGFGGLIAACLGILFSGFGVLSLFFGPLAIITALCFAFFRSKVTLSRRTASLIRGPVFSIVKTKRNALRISFSDIREILVEAEFELGPGEKPFIWHLAIVTNNGVHYPLTWHFFKEPVSLAAQEVARITGKSVREEGDPWNTKKWERWGYNFL